MQIVPNKVIEWKYTGIWDDDSQISYFRIEEPWQSIEKSVTNVTPSSNED